MDSTLPIAMIGKSLNHRLFIFERCSTFAQNFKKMIMNYPMITWCVIAAVLLCAFIFRLIANYCFKHRGRSRSHKATHFLEFGRETDMFYVPGDDKIPGIADKEDESKDQKDEQS